MTFRNLYRRRWLALGLAPLVLAACSGGGGEGEAPALRSLLARGAAHAEIDQWAEARALFERAWELEPGEPAAAYDLAVAAFRTGDRGLAREWLERARAGAPPALAARLELLRARLAYEDGDAAEELAAQRAALDLAPDEAAYAHALAQLHLRRGELEDHAALLERAHRLWPENAFLAAERALWALDQTDPGVRREGLALLEGLVAQSPGGEIAAYLERGRAELDDSGIPRSLRVAVNLLRATPRFQSDAVELQARLEPTPLAAPVAVAGSDGAHPQGPEIRFEAAPLLPDLEVAAGEELLDAAIVDDAVSRREAGGEREAGLAKLPSRVRQAHINSATLGSTGVVAA